jgi:hypothetical protein
VACCHFKQKEPFSRFFYSLLADFCYILAYTALDSNSSINRLFLPKLIVDRLISKHIIESSLSLFSRFFVACSCAQWRRDLQMDALLCQIDAKLSTKLHRTIKLAQSRARSRARKREQKTRVETALYVKRSPKRRLKHEVVLKVWAI